ncbi:leucine-rich_repeat domain-containing protein [Hexamita inflata]|uniref:Leucine-rich_repeat domain-containing protein n=1 Tax=Hexamita inflata TaxID=28002 RepID=A0ABP1J087_9EUKA
MQFLQNIKDGSLYIRDRHELNSLEFLQDVDIQKLTVYECLNIQPKLNNNSIKELNLSVCAIKSIDDLHMNALQSLILYFNKLTQIDHIVSFPLLKELDLSSNENINISPLQHLPLLVKLHMNDCGLKDISVLQSLVNLKELSIQQNAKIDISSLCKLTQIIKLFIGLCDLKYIDFLKFLVNLQEFSVYGNQVYTTQKVGFRRPNVHLTLQENNTNEKELTFNNIVSLDLGLCCLKQIPFIKVFTNLKELFLQENIGVDITPLQNLKQLNKLVLLRVWTKQHRRFEITQQFNGIRYMQKYKPRYNSITVLDWAYETKFNDL